MRLKQLILKAYALSAVSFLFLSNSYSQNTLNNNSQTLCGMSNVTFDMSAISNARLSTSSSLPVIYAIYFTVVRDENCLDGRYKATIEDMKKVINDIEGQKYFYTKDPMTGLPKDQFIKLEFGGAKYTIQKGVNGLSHLPDPLGSMGFMKDNELSALSPNVKAIKVYISDIAFSTGRFPFLRKATTKPGSNDVVDFANMITLSDHKIYGINTFEKELSHELGHYFGLVHTHQGTDVTSGVPSNPEFVDRKDSDIKGDKLEDTQADPNAQICMPAICNPQFCNNNLEDLNPDPTKRKKYQPDTKNLMGYYYTTTRCGLLSGFGFSNFQKEIMKGSKLDYWGFTSGVLHDNRKIFANQNITPEITDFHAGEIRAVKCEAPTTPFENLKPMQDVTVDFSSSAKDRCFTLPGGCGQYIGQNGMPNTGIQKVLPFKNNDPRNGVTTADIVRLRKHILGIWPLDNAYKMIAADVSNSGTISTFDIVLMQRLVLGTIPDFMPYVPSWRFLSQYHENAMPKFTSLDPFIQAYNTTKKYLSTSTTPSYLDHVDIDYTATNDAYNPLNWSFKAIKMGDLDCSANPLKALQGDNDISNFRIAVNQNIRSVVANKEVLVNVILNRATPIEAYQFELGYDKQKVELLSVQAADNTSLSLENNFNTSEKGLIRTLWYSENENKLDSKAQYNLFQLRFKTLQDISNPDDLLHLNTSNFYNTFYNLSLQEVATQLTFFATEVPSVLNKTVKQNTNKVTVFPNPTANELNLSIALEKSSELKIQLTDIFGRVLKTVTTEGFAGKNDILMEDLQQFNAGIIHYQIQTQEGNFQGKVLLCK